MAKMTFKRTPPESGIVEAVLKRSVIMDVVHLLPTHRSKRWRKRDPQLINRVFVHHSGALGSEGFKGMRGSARYSVSDTPKKKGWAGFAYTYWLADLADLMPNGKLVIYRGNPDEARTYHTGGKANTRGTAFCFQGNRTRISPSEEQLIMGVDLVAHLRKRHTLASPDPFCPHSGSKPYGGTGKQTCPGSYIEQWIDAL